MRNVFSRAAQSVIDRFPGSFISRCPASFSIIHIDMGQHDILKDNQAEVVGIIDWECAHTAPMEVFATCLIAQPYLHFDPAPRQRTLVWENLDDAAQHIQDVSRQEQKIHKTGTGLPQLAEMLPST